MRDRRPSGQLLDLEDAVRDFHAGDRGERRQAGRFPDHRVRRTRGASMAFQPHTATGKLNAVITATGPSGCHDSIIRWSGLSLWMTRPCSCLESPVAKSAMSTTSCTSPSPSGADLAHLPRHQGAEFLLVSAEFQTELAHHFAPFRRGNVPPGFESLHRLLDDGLASGRGNLLDLGNDPVRLSGRGISDVLRRDVRSTRRSTRRCARNRCRRCREFPLNLQPSRQLLVHTKNDIENICDFNYSSFVSWLSSCVYASWRG